MLPAGAGLQRVSNNMIKRHRQTRASEKIFRYVCHLSAVYPVKTVDLLLALRLPQAAKLLVKKAMYSVAFFILLNILFSI
jgi:hypothetical protein